MSERPMENGLVQFVGALPPHAMRATKWRDVRDTLAKRPGEWAKIDAQGGYPRQALKALGCEVKRVKGETYARCPGGEQAAEPKGRPCPKCRGVGDVHGVRCWRCGGSGDLAAVPVVPEGTA